MICVRVKARLSFGVDGLRGTKGKEEQFFLSFFLFRVCYLGFRDGAKKRERVLKWIWS